MVAAILSALAAIIVASLTVFLTKRKEREAEWRSKKLAYYEEFFAAVSGIVATAPREAKIRFANAVNNLHLIGSQDVIDALHCYCDQVAESNADRNVTCHDETWSALVWQIRSDLGDRPVKSLNQFKAILWASGAGSNVI